MPAAAHLLPREPSSSRSNILEAFRSTGLPATALRGKAPHKHSQSQDSVEGFQEVLPGTRAQNSRASSGLELFTCSPRK